MSRSAEYVYTTFADPRALRLIIEGQTYEVTQFASSWAVNEVPTAVCALAVGRDVYTSLPAAIHRASAFRQMTRATVILRVQGEYSTVSDWPEGDQIIFEGFFVGFTYRKINGKLNAIANLEHWLKALSFSSALTVTGHPANPTQLNVAAIMPSARSTGAVSGANLTSIIGFGDTVESVATDVWRAIKSIFCRLASTPIQPGGNGDCDGAGNDAINTPALEALARMEGPVAEAACSLAYKWGVPLQFGTTAFTQILDYVSFALTNEPVESYAGTSFWDKLVGRYCPQFGMAIIPRVDTALVVADTPLLGGANIKPWKTINLDEYDTTDGSDELQRPLRGVGVLAGFLSQTIAGIEGGPGAPIIGGCYVEDSVAPGDGLFLYVSAPPWLEGLFSSQFSANLTTGLGNNGAQPTATTPFIGPAAPPSSTVPDSARELFNRYAHMIYASHVLRGRSKKLSGKLRFDIAPGSIVRINPTAERFLGAEDSLATTDYAAVSRVTITINAEAGVAGTTFDFTHRRTEAENRQPRTSVTEHPLFGNAIHGDGAHGCPLLDTFNLP